MRYVFDSSVAVKTVLLEHDSGTARRLIREYDRGDHELIAPDVFPIEVAHAFTKAERQDRIAVGDAEVLWQGVMAAPLRIHTSLPLMLRAISISSDMRIGVYDCLYVALAEREGCEFLTADEKLIRTLAPRFPFIVSLSTL